MVWWPFAPKLERADTLEVTDLHSGAPPLYSTVNLTFLILVAALPRCALRKRQDNPGRSNILKGGYLVDCPFGK